MDVEFITNGIVEEDVFQADDNVNNDNLGVEGETCGICMDIVIDRGLLDCCQHWFCFACIDNWATITNLCPICQNEFQLITCVPVYDTVGSNKVEDDSVTRDDDWFIEGKNNTLSFPSYYIDENAVVCLDGTDCKIRSVPAKIEADSSLDTSIACDSCDIWYHAFCVGFDPEGTSDIRWLCPRCVNDEVHKRTGSNLVEKVNMENDSENANSECQAKDSLSGKVSVSVADTGETAVVVSMVEGNQWIHASSEKGLSPIEGEKGLVTESCVSVSDTNIHQSKTEKTTLSPIMEERELELSLSHNIQCSLPSTSLVHNDSKISAHQAGSESSSFEGIKLSNESYVRTSPSGNESDMGLHLGLSVCSFLSVADMEKNEIKDQAADIKQFKAEETLSKGDEIEPDVDGENASTTGAKRKHVHGSNDQVHMKSDGKDTKPEVVDEVLHKRIKVDKGPQIRPKYSADVPFSENAKKGLTAATVSMDDGLKYCPVKENVASDIMSIVKGTTCKLSKGLAGNHASNKLFKNQENVVGLRVKKIMKRTSDDGESSFVVQNLRKEIREAVCDKSGKHFEENHFDPNLLAAFRAVIAGPKSEHVSKPSPLAMKAKKSMLQKGKVREHLTKKIFATSNGRRKRAWDRDCEIEFWKYRCMRTTKPEKIETLKSVLDLLRKSSRSQEPEQNSECQPNNILSRLYLADTSVFPRKDDVKPLSALNTVTNSEPDKYIPSGKGTNLCLDDNNNIKAAGTNVSSKAGILKSENKVDKKIVHGSVGHSSASGKVHVSSHSEGKPFSSSGGSKVNSKQLGVKLEAMRTDKRKWALEVLARKTATASMKTENGNRDNSIVKGNFPLLVQLPADMRPALASSRHNKIPIVVRQTQLYRLTEHLLRKINLPVIRRSADTELAVADAINIEKGIADRSNSKPVYLNLCSQELMHHSNNRKSNGAPDTNPPVSSAVLADSSEQTGDDLSTDPAVEVALKNAGLLSDSPPSSPLEKRERCHDEDNLSGPENILELDSHPELDIYGDFEYDLEDEDYIGASAEKFSSPQEESESKMKLVFSTVNMKKSDIALDLGSCNRPENSAALHDASCSSNYHSDTGHRDLKIDLEIGKPCVPSEPLISEGAVEPSDAEFEELYGPDKEPLIKKFPEGQSRILLGESNTEILTEDNESCNMKKHASNQPSALINSSKKSHSDETVQRKEGKSDAAAKQSDSVANVFKKVEAYIKEHIRPLCKSGVITAEQYRWAVSKTTDKVMKYHGKAKNANFLIKEGEKVKKLAEQYLDAAQQNKKD